VLYSPGFLGTVRWNADESDVIVTAGDLMVREGADLGRQALMFG
jgi:hypothetical protein